MGEFVMLKCFKLNKKSWRVKYDPTMQGGMINCGNNQEYDGMCFPETRMITLNPLSDCIDLTYKHELVHAILYTMQHELAENEEFVTKFSELLHEAETTIEYKSRYVKMVKATYNTSKANLKMFEQGV
jgi:hypothetical protein